jgi:cellulose synthase/poly-beta-1,6-N-acetylglucosamine synthase-like glycosyltransferase
VVEPRKGLNNARNRALREADTDIVAFIDDDAFADPHWLDALLSEFHPEVACVAGLTLPFELENAAQEEFEAMAGFSKRGFERREFRSPPDHPLAVGGIGAGANMAVRRALLDEIGPFDPALDAGTPTQSGGDHEYFSRILRAGKTIVYEPRALNWHRHRRTREEMLKAVQGYGVGVYASWTRALLVDGEFGVPRRALGWLVQNQIPDLVRGLLAMRDARPVDVTLAELSGCLKGPSAYIRSRRHARSEDAAL